MSGLDDAQIRKLNEIDVNPVVHEITGIVRAGNGMVAMEERLESLGFQFEPEVVEEVLKRCFKVPHLAFRFFNWVKMKDGFCHTTETFNTMLNIAGEAREFKVVDDLVEEMENRYCEMDVKTWSILISQFGKAKLISKALLFFEKMKTSGYEPDEKIYKMMMHSLCNAVKSEAALAFYKEMIQKDMRLDLSLYKMLLNSMAKSGDVGAVHLVADDMNRLSQIPERDVNFCMLKSFCVAGRIREALELNRDLKNKDTLIDYAYLETLVRGLCRGDRIADAVEIVEFMKRRNLIDAKIYGVIVEELCKVSRTDEILKVLYTMQDSKIFIDNKIFKLAITYMKKKGETDNVQKVTQMQRICRLHSLQDEVFGKQELQAAVYCNQSEQGRTDCHLVKPQSKSYSEISSEQGLLQEICKILSSSKDWRIMEEALENRIFQFTPGLVLEILHNCSTHVNASLKFFSWVGKQTCYCHTTETYNMAMKISGREQDFKLMKSLFYEMKRKGGLITPDTWEIMIMQYGRTGLTEVSLKTFNEMKNNGYTPNESTYKYLLIGLCGKRGRKVDEAIKIFHEMIGSNYIPDREVVSTYLGCLCEAGKLLEARECTESLCKTGYTIPSCYSLHIRALCLAGRLEEALSLLDEAGTERERSTTLDQKAYRALVAALVRNGRGEEASAKIDSMKKAGIKLDFHVYKSLFVHFLKEKQIEKATEIIEKMQHKWYEPTLVTYSTMIWGYMKLGRVDDAWNVLNHLKLKGPKPNLKTYSLFVVSLCKAGKSEEALQLLSKMLEEDGIVPSTINFRTVITGLNCEGKYDLARTVMQQKLSLKSKCKFSK